MQDDASEDQERREKDAQDRQHRLFWDAFNLLAREFKRSLAESPYLPVPTPHDSIDETPAIDLIARTVEGEADYHTLADMVRICIHCAAFGNEQASDVIERLARAHANHYANRMRQQGDFQ